jgi:hypothetical protein
MPADKRLFRNADEAIAYHRGALNEKGASDLYGARFWQAFHEENPGLDPKAVERAIKENWDQLERMPTDQAMGRLVEAAGGRRQQAPPAHVEGPKKKDLWDPNETLSISDLVHKRREERRVMAAAGPRSRTA